MLRSFAKGDRRRAVHIIPVIDIGSNGLALLAERERARALALVDATRRQFTPVALRLLDGTLFRIGAGPQDGRPGLAAPGLRGLSQASSLRRARP